MTLILVMTNDKDDEDILSDSEISRMKIMMAILVLAFHLSFHHI